MILTILVLLWLLGFLLFWRLPVCGTGDESDGLEWISIVIPARDEETNIGRLLASIRSNPRQPLEVIVVDDGSKDRTAEIAARYDAVVLEPGAPPSGWRGKAWACQQGGSRASGQILLFLDADTWLYPDALERMYGELKHRRLKALSLGPFHETQDAYEQGSAVFNLMTFMGMGAFSIWDSVDCPGGLFGPCLLIDRELYRKVDGHTQVRGEILEHMSLSPILAAEGGRIACLGGHEVLHTRMYPDGPGRLIEGWTKAFATGASKTSPSRLFLVVLWICGSLLPFLGLAVNPRSWWFTVGYGLGYLLFVVQWRVFLRRLGRFSIWSAIIYPVNLVFFFAVFGRSAFLRATGGKVVWKGRSIAESL